MHNVYALLVTAALVALILLGLGVLAYTRVVPGDVARKLMHISAGITYMSIWPLYEDVPSSRWLAAGVIALTTTYFLAVGMGSIRDPYLTASATRTGRPRDLLKGPMLYGIAHTVVTVIFWRTSPQGVMALSALCGGDGLAVFGGMAGRKLGPVGRMRLPWNPTKSWAGTISCFLGSLITAVPLLLSFRDRGFFLLEDHDIWRGCILCSIVSALIESLPYLPEYDNLTVPIAVALAGSRAHVF